LPSRYLSIFAIAGLAAFALTRNSLRAQSAAQPDRQPSQHWAYRLPVRRPPLPAVRNVAWVRTPIDRFVLARLDKEGLGPSPQAPLDTLINP